MFHASIHWHSDDKGISSPQGGMVGSTPIEVDDPIIVTSSFLGKLKLLSLGLFSSRSDENKGCGSNRNIGREGYVSGSDPKTVKKGGEGIGDAGVDVCVFL